MHRPITAVCVGGPKHGELVTYSGSLLPGGVVRLPVPVRPSTSVARHASYFEELPVFDYEIRSAPAVMCFGWYATVNVLAEPGTSNDFPDLWAAVVFIMAMRGWLGFDEGERWTVVSYPVVEGEG